MWVLAGHCSAGRQQVTETHVRCEVEPEAPETQEDRQTQSEIATP